MNNKMKEGKGNLSEKIGIKLATSQTFSLMISFECQVVIVRLGFEDRKRKLL